MSVHDYKMFFMVSSPGTWESHYEITFDSICTTSYPHDQSIQSIPLIKNALVENILKPISQLMIMSIHDL